MWSDSRYERTVADAAALVDEFIATRALTERLLRNISVQDFHHAHHPDFSPIAWHLGHIAFFEARWALEHAHGESSFAPAEAWLFDPQSIPKPRRVDLPGAQTLLRNATRVRQRTLEHLRRETASASNPDDQLRRGLYVYRLVLAHEQQHAETIATVLRMRSAESRAHSGFPLPEKGEPVNSPPLRFDASEAQVGEDDRLVGYDNERGAHRVRLGPFELESTPVTNARWLGFVREGGYFRRELWTAEGWSWREMKGIERPYYWSESDEGIQLRALGGNVPLPLHHPVDGVSAYEADAFARWSGARLPTESEWEHAARTIHTGTPCFGLSAGSTRPAGRSADLLGNVWEWTSSTFLPYPGFRPDPYERYSLPWFDGRHRVLRGGSFATQALNLRPSFRNWYEPHWRAMFAGVRLARDR